MSKSNGKTKVATFRGFVSGRGNGIFEDMPPAEEISAASTSCGIVGWTNTFVLGATIGDRVILRKDAPRSGAPAGCRWIMTGRA